MKRIAFIVQYPPKVSPGQRFRFELWEPILKENNFHVDTFPFFDKSTHKIIYKNEYLLKKIFGIIMGFCKRISLLFKIKSYDYIILQRGFTPIGIPIFEWFTAKILRVKIIYDFDDAIWIANTTKENKIARWFKACWKVKYICKWAYKVVVGNEYLATYARQYNKNIILIPTCVSTESSHNRLRNHKEGQVIIGWTGSHSTLKYLNELESILQELQEELDFTFLIIADRNPNLALKNKMFLPWNINSEISDLLKLDIGVMPLTSDAWSEGKCGFKLIQYLALGIPAVASPIGVNKNIIVNNITGFLAYSREDWKKYLKRLALDVDLRERMGRFGREKVIEQYSIQSQKEKYLNLFS